MPEGDTIYRTAAALRKAVLGRIVLRFETSVPEVAAVHRAREVRGRVFAKIEPRGKNLLVVLRRPDSTGPAIDVPSRLDLGLFDSDLVLHTHLRMTGSWHIYRPGECWQKPERYMKAVFHTDEFVIPCFSAPVVSLMTASQTVRDGSLTALGPDAMDDDFDEDHAVRLLSSLEREPIGVALMNQRLMAGVGNVYKSEVLFINRVNPFASVVELPEQSIRGLVIESHRLLVLNRSKGERRTVYRLDERQLLWVYGRGGQPCRVCGENIGMRRQGLEGRSTYYCPRCQA